MSITSKIDELINKYQIINGGERPKNIILDGVQQLTLERECYDELNHPILNQPKFPPDRFIQTYKGITIIDKDKCIIL